MEGLGEVEMKELEELLDSLREMAISRDDEDEEDGDEAALELQIKTKKKEKKPASLDQLFDELIREYNRKHSPEFVLGGRMRFGEGPEDEDWVHREAEETSETLCTVKLAVKNYLNIVDKDGERFVLLPDRDGERFEAGGEYVLYTRQYKEHSFLLFDSDAATFRKYSPLFEGTSAAERRDLLGQAKADPEGFALWGKLGPVKRADRKTPMVRQTLLVDRADRVLVRIPREREDLYRSLEETIRRCISSPGNEKADRQKDLEAKMTLISLMLSSRRKAAAFDAQELAARLPGACVKAGKTERREQGWLPNILLVGRDCDGAAERLADPEHALLEISLGGVEGNDYLFGDPMCYAGTRIGELTCRLIERPELPETVLFRDVDLMGTTVRSGNPLFGLASLMRRHRYTDFYMRDLTADVRSIQFICHVDRMEDCPALLLREMDLVVEL